MWDKILDKNGHLLHGVEHVQKRQKEFYEELYTTQNIASTREQDNFFLEHLNSKLTDEYKAFLDSDISIDEISKSLYLMSNNKSPGPDGICVEFYKMYWKDIKHDLFDCFMEGLQNQELSYTQYLAMITLLYKKGIREDIKNWRPISLLNVDFKIISKSLSERLKKVMPSIIHTDQRGCIRGRYIGENIRLVEDILQSKDDDSVILLLDQEKAFDRVEWSWLYKVLTAFNFGENVYHG